jgi:hypothetical protein
MYTNWECFPSWHTALNTSAKLDTGQCSASVKVYSSQEQTVSQQSCNLQLISFHIDLLHTISDTQPTGEILNWTPDKAFLFLLYYTDSFLSMSDSAELSTAISLASAAAMQEWCHKVYGKQSFIQKITHIIQIVNVYSTSKYYLNWTHVLAHSTDAICTTINGSYQLEWCSTKHMNFWRHNAIIFSNPFNNFNTN